MILSMKQLFDCTCHWSVLHVNICLMSNSLILQLSCWQDWLFSLAHVEPSNAGTKSYHFLFVINKARTDHSGRSENHRGATKGCSSYLAPPSNAGCGLVAKDALQL